MSKRLDAMKSNPKANWKIEDVEALCREFGIARVAPSGGGSHFKVSQPSIKEILTIPARRPIKPVYPESWFLLGSCYEGTMTANDYAIIVEPLPQDEGGGFVATVPDLPGCMSDGQTPHEALANVQDAIKVWIEAATEMGRKIPPPMKRYALAG